MSEPTKIAQLIWSLEIGGAERVVVSLVENLNRQEFEPIVICLNHKGRLATQLERNGVKVFALNKKAGLDIGLPGKLAHVLREEKVEIVHAHLFGAAFWGRLAGKRACVRKTIVHEHGMQPWRGKMHFLIDRLLAGRTSHYLFASERVRDYYVQRSGIDKAKSSIVPNGVPCNIDELSRAVEREKNNWREKDLVVVSVGRLSPEKGHASLVQAFAKVRTALPSAQLVLIGDGPERPRLESMAAEAGVVFAGAQDEVAPWLAAADLYVQPSVREGLSLAVLEAMGAGIPVIATRVGDIEKVIVDGKSGFLVPPADNERLAEKIIGTLKALPELAELRANARKTVQESYSVEAMVREVEQVYRH